jgi:membrane associated rhomboid family serine protease
MASPDPPTLSDHEQVPEELAVAGIYPTAAAGFDHGLVVVAMGWSYWLVPADGGYRLLVEPQVLAAAREQLACFDRESIGWPPRPPVEAAARRGSELLTPLLWAGAVVTVFGCQQEWPGRLEAAGVLDARAVFDHGEYWRLATALFLHANVGHLVANTVSGIFAFAAVLTTLGRRRGWLLLALAALAGNLAAAALNYPFPYRSLGASTAIFAALGLLTGRAVRVLRQRHRPWRWRAVLVPLAAGLALLALFGAGGPQTDVGAHLTGFVAGLALGFAMGPRVAITARE